LIYDKKEDELLRFKKDPTAYSTESNLDIAIQTYEEKVGIKVFPLLIQDKRFPWLQASIDGFSEDFSKLLMVDCSEDGLKNAQMFQKKSKLKLDDKKAQFQHLLMITGLEEIDYWCYSKNKTPVLITIKRDQGLIKQLYKLEKSVAEKLNIEESDNLNKQFADILKGAGMKF